MSREATLAPLLAALRDAGLGVGVTEVARLQRVFALAPELEAAAARDRLLSVLRAVVVKAPGDGATLERVFDAWFARAESGLERVADEAARVREPAPGDARPERRTDREQEPSQKQRRARVATALGALVLLTALMLPASRVLPPTRVEPTPVPTASPTPAPAPTPRATQQTVTYTVLVPTITVSPGEPRWTGWRYVAVALGALAFAGAIWVRYRRRQARPAPAPTPTVQGPPRVLLAPPLLDRPQLLDERQQDTLVWGVGRFVSDEPTRRLDLPATVRATARSAGIPAPRFHTARHQREIWLWVDEGTPDTSLGRLADEIEAALRAHGLPVERATFRGVPDYLVTPHGEAFAPAELDERRDVAIVAILTDGRNLTRKYEADHLHVGVAALLRQLAHWPRLCFVDFSDGTLDPAPILREHGIDVVAPADLPAFLGADGATPSGRVVSLPVPSGEAALWAGACAVAPSEVSEGTALRLRKHLRLNVSPWALRALRAEAGGSPGRLVWPRGLRVQRVNALREADAPASDAKAHAGSTLAEGSLMRRTFDFWSDQYVEEDEHRRASGLPWDGTPAQQHLVMEQALLDLWQSPASATRRLYELHQGTLRDEVEAHLADMAPADLARDDQLALPWNWSDRPAIEQTMLQEMKLGGASLPAIKLHHPGRLWLGLGLCAGATLGALWFTTISPMHVDPPVISPIGESPVSLSSFYFDVVTLDERGAVKERLKATARQFTEDLGAGVSLDMVLIPGGSFTMGSPSGELDRVDWEEPQHPVTVGRFLMGKFEVTQAQWRAVAQRPKVAVDLTPDPAYFKGADRPVENVSWNQAIEFCARLSKATGRLYRLPSEAEWEYAARAWTTTPFHFGETITAEWVNYDGNYPYGRAPRGLYRAQTTRVGELGAANAFGLFDVHGNVWEWVQDTWHENYAGAPNDGRAWESGGDTVRRVLRGGAWLNNARFSRSAVRRWVRPELRYDLSGFRVVCAVSRTQ